MKISISTKHSEGVHGVLNKASQSPEGVLLRSTKTSPVIIREGKRAAAYYGLSGYNDLDFSPCNLFMDDYQIMPPKSVFVMVQE